MMRTDVPAPYPWQTEQWRQLLTAYGRDRLSHAYLFSGRDGSGVGRFADRFAQVLLCEADSEAGICGACRGCTLFAAGNHPDLRKIVPHETGKQIGVDQIRELGEFYELTAHYGQHKVSIIDPAEAMNRAAANALLKTLEEPPRGAVIVLVCHRVSAIPMTVRSRCQRLTFENVDQAAALRWLSAELGDAEQAAIQLSAAMGAPLLASEIFADGGRENFYAVLEACHAACTGRVSGFELAKRVGDVPLLQQIEWLSLLVYEVSMRNFGASPYYGSAVRAERAGSEDTLKALADRINFSGLYDFSDLLFEAKALLLSNASVREADLADQLWLALAGAVSRNRTPIAGSS